MGLITAGLLSAGFLMLPSAAQTPPATATAGVNQDGWWNFDTYPLADLPPELAPVATLVPPLPSQTTVPANALGVGAQAGDSNKVAAIGIKVTVPTGHQLDSLILVVSEHADAQSQLAAQTAIINACPILDFWATDRNGDWRQVPPADCAKATTTGQRAESGNWTFDLTTMGRLWVDRKTSGLFQNGIVLQEGVEPPSSFQVSLLDSTSGGMTVTVASSPDPTATSAPAPGTTVPVTTQAGTPPPPTTIRPATTTPPTAARPTVGPPRPPGPTVATSQPTAPVTTAAGGAPTTGAPADPPTASPIDDAASSSAPGGLSRALLLLIPVVLALAGVITYVLGPAGEPTEVFRAGGVSRALARRQASSLTPLEAS